MHLGKRKAIAVMISRVSAEFQRVLVENIEKRAASYGYYTLVYHSFGAYGNNQEFVDGEMYLADMPDYENLDGIILVTDTFAETALADKIIDNVKRRATCPVVCVRRAVADYPAVLVDDENSMEGITRHLVEDHKYTDFCYVGGPEDHPDAINRITCFQRVLAEYGLECTDGNVFYGDFWRNCGDRAVEYLLDGREKNPDVIVCANDYMAIAVMNALRDRGIRVPEDIAITGFDDISEAQASLPLLSTVRVDVAALAEHAVDMLNRLHIGETLDEKYEYIPTQIVVRQSCGCEIDNEKQVELGLREYFNEMNRYLNYNMQTIFMSIDGETAKDVDELAQVVYTYVFNNVNFRDFFFVMNEYDWGTQDSADFNGFTEKVHLRMAIQENLLLGHIDHVFDFHDVLPEEYVYDEPCAYYIVPMHYQTSCFGYCMINYKEGSPNGAFFQYLVTNICNAYESIRIRQKMNLLIDQLQNMSISDILTGLYNRHGFENDSKAMYRKAVNENRSLCIMGIDMDGLKTINDTFGHAHGDIALKAIANAISAACYADETCYRVGGDEFQVLALDYTEEMATIFIERLNGFLDDYNARSKRPYIVQASYGFSIADPAGERTLGEWTTMSDDLMYQHKESRRAARKIVREPVEK